MRMPSIRKVLLASLVLGSFLPHLAGCGTVLYPERRGQPAGKYDTDVVILNAIGLVFFIVPGVIAFGVDFATGAIYLPEGGQSRAGELFGALEIRQHLVEGRTIEDLERAVRDHTGLTVDLGSPSTRIARVPGIHDPERRLLSLNGAIREAHRPVEVLTTLLPGEGGN